MAGSTGNTAVWGGADVLVGSLTAAIPVANAAFVMNTAERAIAIGTTSGSAAITSSALFTSADVGATITGTGIPASTTILSVTDTSNATLSANATATGSPTATIGATTNGWDYIGLLDGGQGFEEGVEVTSTDHEAWGYGVVATTYKGQKTTKTFTALEENEAVMGRVYDIDGMTFDDVAGTYVGDLATKDFTERVRVAFITTSGTNEKRMISKNYCTIAATAAGAESEEALQSKSFTATIYPDSNRVLWYAYKGASL